MNLPNKLTVFRILLIPFFLFFLLTPSALPTPTASAVAALVIFAVASLTDLLDGRIARRRGIVTNFGILMDPLADKMLVMSALVCFIRVLDVPPVVVVILLAREFLVTSMRLVAAGKGVVIAADRWGKVKTATQMGWLTYGLFYLCVAPLLAPGPLETAARLIFQLGMWASLFFALLSGANYVIKNISLFKD